MKIYGNMKLSHRIFCRLDSIFQWIRDIDWFLIGISALMVATVFGLAMCASMAVEQIARLL